MNCSCKKKGLAHWWKYLRVRLWWRSFWVRLDYQEATIDGQKVWLRYGWPYIRIYNQYPGASMSRDEYEHWYQQKE